MPGGVRRPRRRSYCVICLIARIVEHRVRVRVRYPPVARLVSISSAAETSSSRMWPPMRAEIANSGQVSCSVEFMKYYSFDQPFAGIGEKQLDNLVDDGIPENFYMVGSTNPMPAPGS